MTPRYELVMHDQTCDVWRAEECNCRFRIVPETMALLSEPSRLPNNPTSRPISDEEEIVARILERKLANPNSPLYKGGASK